MIISWFLDQTSVWTKDKGMSRWLVGNRGMNFPSTSQDERKWPDSEFGPICRMGQGYWRLLVEELATLVFEGQEPWIAKGKRRKIQAGK